MDRRSFTALLPALLAAPALLEHAGAQTPKPAPAPLKSGDFPAFTPPAEIKERAGHGFFLGMVPGSDGNNIRLESHVTYLAPNAVHEPVEKHKHSEMWLVREGTVELNLNGVPHILNVGQVGVCVAGDMHYIKNVGPGRASYFVVSVGPPEG